MGSSIKSGIQKMIALKSIDAVIITVCDQPNISARLLDSMIKLYQEERPKAIACAYNDVIGVPALFDSILFSELQMITGDKGARRLLEKYRDQIRVISCPEGALDIDTPKEYEDFISRSKDEN